MFLEDACYCCLVKACCLLVEAPEADACLALVVPPPLLFPWDCFARRRLLLLEDGLMLPILVTTFFYCYCYPNLLLLTFYYCYYGYWCCV